MSCAKVRLRTALAKLVAMCFKYARTRTDFLQILGRWVDNRARSAPGPHTAWRRWRR